MIYIYMEIFFSLSSFRAFMDFLGKREKKVIQDFR